MLIDKILSVKLRNAMEDWLSANSRSQSMLARMAGTSQSTVRRILQDEVVPEEGTAQRIARIVMKQSDFDSLMKDMSPQLQKNLSITYPKAVPDSLSSALRRDENVRIITLATAIDGTDGDEVTRKYGESHLSYFKDLCDSGVLERRANRWFVAEADVSDFSLDLARDVISTFAKMGDRENDSIPGAAIAWTACESVSPEVFEEIRDDILELNAKILKKISEPKNKGPILLAMGNVMNIIKGREYLV